MKANELKDLLSQASALYAQSIMLLEKAVAAADAEAEAAPDLACEGSDGATEGCEQEKAEAETPKPILSLPALTEEDKAEAESLYEDFSGAYDYLADEASNLSELHDRLESQEEDVESAKSDYERKASDFLDHRSGIASRILYEWRAELEKAGKVRDDGHPLFISEIRTLFVEEHGDEYATELNFVFDLADMPDDAPDFNASSCRLERYDIDDVSAPEDQDLGLGDYFSFQKNPEESESEVESATLRSGDADVVGTDLHYAGQL